MSLDRQDAAAASSVGAAGEFDDYESLGDNATFGVSLLAGALAGIGEHAVFYPLDFIKTRMQVIGASPSAMYSSTANAFSRISTSEGAMAMWRGVNSVILGAGPAHAVYFGTYELAKEGFGGNEGDGNHPLAHAAAGACATIASDALMNPFDVIKQRMQVHGSVYRSVFDCARNVYAKEGLYAFYISYPTTLTMTIPFTAVQFSTYEYFRRILNPDGHYSPVTHMTAGGLAGAVAAAVTTPLDVAKTLLQTRGTATDAELRNVRGLGEAFRIIYRRDGLSGFSRGMQPRILTNMPSTAICWSIYEFFKYFIIKKANEAAQASSIQRKQILASRQE